MASRTFGLLRGSDSTLTRALDSLESLVRPLAQRLLATPIMGAPVLWITPSIDPPWTAADAIGGHAENFDRPAYHKDCLGYVHIKGTVETTTATTAAETRIFRLPQGYRPARYRAFPAASFRGTTSVFNEIHVDADGWVHNGIAFTGGAGSHLHLEVSFLAED